jgi:hypothetical protein
MRIGESFDKIEFELFGLDLLEPNTFIGDLLLAIVALVFSYRIYKMGYNSSFYKSWQIFFFLFGISFFLGGLGHLFYNYWEIAGKTPSWHLGIIAVYFIEKAMISIHQNQSLRNTLFLISRVKLVLAIIAAIMVNVFVDLHLDYTKGMIVPTINSTVGIVFSLGYLGYQYSKLIRSFRFFWISVLLLLPSIFLQGLNINFAQWFDKNDASHLLLIISLYLYYLGVKGYKNSALTNNR